MADQRSGGASPKELDDHWQAVDARAALAQARWLYEQHESRSQSARNRATALLTFSGALISLAPGLLPDGPTAFQVGLLVAAMAAGVLAGWRALRVLRPSAEVEGLPRVAKLRERAGKVVRNESRADSLLAELNELMRATDLDKKSPVDHALDDANRRVNELVVACNWMAAAFVLTAILALQTAVFR